MRWVVTLSGRPQDIERLAAESLPGLSVPDTTPLQLRLELVDPEGDATADDAPHAAKAVIDATVRHINGFGKLRWGRSFEGIEASATMSIDAAGKTTQLVFPDPAVAHVPFEDFADMVERMGYPRPSQPAGLDVINALDGAAVATLAETNPDVGRALHLVSLMLEGDHDIDWVAGYSALEAVEHDLKGRRLTGIALGWWTRSEYRRFKGTANSVEALGFRARHGKPSGVAEAQMSYSDASWFVRRAVALWITHLLTLNPDGGTAQAPTSDEA